MNLKYITVFFFISITVLLPLFFPYYTFAQSNNWQPTSDSIYERSHREAILLTLTGKVLTVGGDSDDGSSNQSEEYNPIIKLWYKTSNLNEARKMYTMHEVRVNGTDKVVVIGGYGKSYPLRTIELYDESSGTWSTGASMNIPRLNHASVKLKDGTILIIGGDITGNNHSTNSVELYNPTTNTWGFKSSMTIPRYTPTATLLNDGRVLVAGGSTPDGAQSTIEIYNPSTNIWEAGPTMNYARSLHSATLLPNGNVLLAGGVNSSADSASTYEVFDPNSNTIILSGKMKHSHRDHTASLVILKDGITSKVLITGDTNKDTSKKAEVYDYVKDIWKEVSDMSESRSGHSAVNLNDQMVLIFGGKPFAKTSEYFISE